MRRSCDRCLWTDVCSGTKVCDHYTPSEDEEDFPSLAEVERARAEYEEAWAFYSDMDYDCANLFD